MSASVGNWPPPCPAPGSVEALDLTLRRVWGGVVTVVVVLVLRGREQPDPAVQAAVVEPVDVLGDGDLKVLNEVFSPALTA